jgi:hypothetical protein
MAKARPVRRATPGKPTARPEAPARSGWIKQSLITALALVASAVFLAQVIRPAGMLAAMFQYEYGLLDPNRIGQPADRATWETIYAELHSALAELPEAYGRDAVSILLRTLIKADREKLTAEDLARAKQAAETDADNLLSRVTYAVIVDSQSGTADPAVRYKKMQEIIERAPQPKKATLYIGPFTRKWEEILRPHFKQRREMSARFAASMEHFEIDEHYQALPIIRKRLFELASLLPDIDKFHPQPNRYYCMIWLRRLLFGIMREEEDAGTRLLCADQMAQWNLFGMGADQSMRDLRREFHAHAVASPVDVLELWRTPATDGSAYRIALGTLGCAGALLACGIGAAVVMVLATLCGIIWRSQTSSPISRAGFRSKALMIIRIAAPTIAMALLMGWKLAANGPYSPTYELMLAAACIIVGVIVAAWAATPPSSAIRLGCVFILFIASMLVALSSPGSIAWQCRRIDMVIPSALVIFALVACLIVIISIASPLDWRTLGRQATTAFAVNACAALIMLQIHEAADRRYQDSIIAHRLDEMPARLGDDWESRYLVEPRIAEATTQP